MSFSAKMSKEKMEASSPVSSIIAKEQRPMDSTEERSRASPENFEVDSNPTNRSQPGCNSGSKSAPALPRPYSFTPPFNPSDSNSLR